MFRKPMRIALASLMLAAAPISADAATDILFLIDSSGSMKQALNGTAKIDSARAAARRAITSVPSDSWVGLRAYAHRVEQADKTGSCQDSELLIQLAALNQQQFSDKLQALAPKGYTPIAYSLREARKDFDVARESNRAIILLSDGEETCGGDPVAEVKKLRADGFDVTVHTIGFDVGDKDRAQLKAIAEAGGGKYFDARNEQQLVDSLTEATKESALIQKKAAPHRAGRPIRGGDSFETAVALPLNEPLSLDHHQRKGQQDFFAFDLKQGQQIKLEVKTFEKGLRIYKEQADDTDNPYAQMSLHDATFKKLKNLVIIGKTLTTETATFVAPNDGKYYLAVGSEYEAMHKDYVQFSVTLEVKGDLAGDLDAGATVGTALKLTPGVYEKNYLGGNDKSDYFAFEAKEGEQFQFTVIPEDGSTLVLSQVVRDPLKRVIDSTSSASPGSGNRTKPFDAKETGTFTVEVRGSGSEELSLYSLEMKKLREVAAQ